MALAIPLTLKQHGGIHTDNKIVFLTGGRFQLGGLNDLTQQ